MARELNEVGVVGLGTMGAGIVEVLARAGLSVTAVEINDEALARGRGHLEHSTDRAVSRGKLDPAERDAIFERIRFSTSLEDLADAELVIEAVPERMELKAEVFAAAGQDLPAGHDPGDQHLEPVGHRALGGHRPAEQGHRDALLQPGAGHEAGRGRAHRRHRAVGRRGRRGAGRRGWARST